MDPLKFKLTIAYDGTATKAGRCRRSAPACRRRSRRRWRNCFPAAPRVHSSSRTDTGVHALGMVAHFEIPRAECRMPPRKLALALNAWLPEDIRVLSAARAPAGFPRALRRGRQAVSLLRLEPPGDESAAPAHAPGTCRARSTCPRCAPPRQVLRRQARFPVLRRQPGLRKESTVRTLTRCDLKQPGPLLTFIIEGDGFLYKMCRGIVGTLVQVGLGKFPPAKSRRMLAKKDRRVAGMTAPAHGLVLWKVFYSKSVAADVRRL